MSSCECGIVTNLNVKNIFGRSVYRKGIDSILVADNQLTKCFNLQSSVAGFYLYRC